MRAKRLIARLLQAQDTGLPGLPAFDEVLRPGLSVSVDQMLDSLFRIGGPARRAPVRCERDARIESIVSSWPDDFDVTRAMALGFTRDDSLDAVIRQYVVTLAA